MISNNVDKLSTWIYFFPLAKPGVAKDEMTEWA